MSCKLWMRWSWIFLTLISVLVTPLSAQEDTATEPRTERVDSTDNGRNGEGKRPFEDYNFWDEFSKMLYYLGGVILFMLLAAWFFKRAMHTRMQQMNLSSSIKILERRPLTPKSALYLVEVLGKGVIIAETPGSISLVTELPPGTDLASLQETPSRSFAEILKTGKKDEVEE